MFTREKSVLIWKVLFPCYHRRRRRCCCYWCWCCHCHHLPAPAPYIYEHTHIQRTLTIFTISKWNRENMWWSANQSWTQIHNDTDKGHQVVHVGLYLCSRYKKKIKWTVYYKIVVKQNKRFVFCVEFFTRLTVKFTNKAIKKKMETRLKNESGLIVDNGINIVNVTGFPNDFVLMFYCCANRQIPMNSSQMMHTNDHHFFFVFIYSLTISFWLHLIGSG